MLPIHDENRSVNTPYVNYGLILVNVLVFFFFFLGGTRMLRDGIFSFGAVPIYIVNGERLWTLLTSMFMHADIMHLLGNIVYLWVFGDNIEDVLGHTKYLAFYLLGGLTASFTHVASLLVALPSIGIVGLGVPSVGASGAISAVLGAYLLLYPSARIRTLVFYIFISIVSIPAYYYLGFWFLYQLIMGVFSLTGFSSGVAFWAHIGGFAAGYAIMWFLRVKPKVKPKAKLRGRRPFRPLIVKPSISTPLVDVMVELERLNVVAELPGVEEKDINVEVYNQEIVISAEHRERRYYARIELPAPVYPQITDFSYRNGVLSFNLRRRV